MEIDLHLLDTRYERLRVRNTKEESRLLGLVAEEREVSPVIVVRSEEDISRYVLIDGFKRLRAIRKIGKDVIQAMVWDHTETDALVMIHNLQRPR